MKHSTHRTRTSPNQRYERSLLDLPTGSSNPLRDALEQADARAPRISDPRLAFRGRHKHVPIGKWRFFHPRSYETRVKAYHMQNNLGRTTISGVVADESGALPGTDLTARPDGITTGFRNSVIVQVRDACRLRFMYKIGVPTRSSTG